MADYGLDRVQSVQENMVDGQNNRNRHEQIKPPILFQHNFTISSAFLSINGRVPKFLVSFGKIQKQQGSKCVHHPQIMHIYEYKSSALAPELPPKRLTSADLSSPKKIS